MMSLNNPNDNNESSNILSEKISKFSPFNRQSSVHFDSVAVCYLERSQGECQQFTFSRKIDAPDENKEFSASLARLGRSLSREVFPGVVPCSSMAIFSRSSDPLRVNLWSAFTINGTLFFQPPSYNSWVYDDFRTCIMAILELAEIHLSCQKVVVCLHKDGADAADFVKALMYVGFELCRPGVYNQTPDYLLVGYEI